MAPKQKRRVYVGLAMTCLALFVIGLVYGYRGRHTPICKDGRPPKQQQDVGLGRVLYLCHDGQIVTKP
jgi:hypothetical protein